MKFNQWTLRLAAAGVISLAGAALGEEVTSHPVMTALSSTTLSGFVDTSAQWNLGSGNVHAPGYLFGGPSKADGFNLNVVKLVLEKPVQPSDEWGTGYKVNLLFGPDANAYATQSLGATPDFAVKQAYVEVKAPVGNGIDFKMGVWDTILGYEVFEPTINPNYTKSYGYSIEPATFTGVIANYNITELIGVAAGIADNEGSAINSRSTPLRSESYKTYLGDLSLTAPSTWGWVSGSTLFFGVVNGFNAFAAAAGFHPADQTSFYSGLSLSTPWKALKVGASYDYAGVAKQSLSAEGYANAVGAYVSYQLTEKIALNERGEYFTQSKSNGGPGLPSKIVAFTSTVQYDLWQNVLTRLELRWDHSADGSLAYGGTSASPVPNHKNSIEVIASAIYKF